MINEDFSIKTLKEIARQVFSNVKEFIGTKKGAEKLERGAGGDISLKIDIIAEETIKNYLIANNLEMTLISEELGEEFIGKKVENKINKRKLIVDPIDGSNNTSRGIPFYSVSIAYANGDKLSSVKKAVILDLNTGDLYWAEKGKGAYFNEKKIKVSNNDLSNNLIFEIDFYIWNFKRKLKKYSSIMNKLYRIRSMGSVALSLSLLAKGSIDGYINFKKNSRVVDYAAAYLIINEAGGKIFSIKGDDIDFTLDMDLKTPLVASNDKLEDFLRNELKKINS